jgi:hypothetical protein
MTTGFDGDFGRGTGSQDERRAVVRVLSMGNSAMGDSYAMSVSVIGRVSGADASLSLSLSLSGIPAF